MTNLNCAGKFLCNTPCTCFLQYTCVCVCVCVCVCCVVCTVWNVLLVCLTHHWSCSRPVWRTAKLGQNHIYTVCIRYFWRGNHHIHHHIRCIYTQLWPDLHTAIHPRMSKTTTTRLMALDTHLWQNLSQCSPNTIHHYHARLKDLDKITLSDHLEVIYHLKHVFYQAHHTS